LTSSIRKSGFGLFTDARVRAVGFQKYWRFAAKASMEKFVKKLGWIIAVVLLLATSLLAQTYTNANLNGVYSVQFSSPQTYSWSKTFSCPTNSQITFTVNTSITGNQVSVGNATFDGNGNVSVTLTQTGSENQAASANTTSVTWNSSCQVTGVNNGRVIYLATSTKTQTGTYSIQSNGTGTMSETGSSQSQTLLLAATTGGLSTTVLITNPQVNGKIMGTGIAVHQ
jgi:hypothetical protein